LSRGIPVHTQEVRHKIRILASAEVARIVGGHGLADESKKIAGRLAVPFAQELVTRQGWASLAAAEILAVAFGAFFAVG
jgi:hypothetical protein